MSSVRVTFLAAGSVQIASSPADMHSYSGAKDDELDVPEGDVGALVAAGLVRIEGKVKSKGKAPAAETADDTPPAEG
jgi:hypothetical protein